MDQHDPAYQPEIHWDERLALMRAYIERQLAAATTAPADAMAVKCLRALLATRNDDQIAAAWETGWRSGYWSRCWDELLGIKNPKAKDFRRDSTTTLDHAAG